MGLNAGYLVALLEALHVGPPYFFEGCFEFGICRIR
jgi:hypothetical protein